MKSNKFKYGVQAVKRIHPDKNDCPKDIEGYSCDDCKIAWESVMEGISEFNIVERIIFELITISKIFLHPIRFIKFVKNTSREGSK